MKKSPNMLRSLSFLILSVFAAISFAQTVDITSNITSNTTWTNNNTYVIKEGFHYVTDGATLTIEPGTLILGEDGTLVITRGCKIIAEGTATQPIVFTSSKAPGARAAGDWGGIAILGRAPINDPANERLLEGGLDATLGLYGPGTEAANPEDNSGVLKFVRIEYSGIFYLPNNEINGLTLGGVGRGTTIEHVQVSYNQDDSFEWFGGTVNGRHLVSYKTLDDDFDTDYGYQGKVQFGLVIREPNTADVSRSNMFESDNDATGSTNTPQTNPTFSNITALGPIQTSPANTISSNYGRALHLRRSTGTDVYNSVFAGYPTGLMIDGANCIGYAGSGSLNFNHNILAGITGLALDTVYSGAAPSFDVDGFLAASSVETLPVPTDLGYVDPYAANAPDLHPAMGSPVLDGSDYTGLDAFFENVPFRGAFGAEADLWTACWTEFDPQNAVYTSPISYLTASFENTTIPVLGDDLVVTASAGSTFQWLLNDVVLNETTNTLTTTTEGNYVVRVRNERGCVIELSKFVTTSSSSDLLGKQSLMLNPNPATDLVNVSFNWTGKAQTLRITLTDLSGRRLLNLPFNANVGDNDIELPTESLPRGNYILSVTDGSRVTSSTLLLK